MRKIAILFTLFALSVSTYAQVSVVLKAGVNLSSYSGLADSEKDLQEYRPGYMFSAGVEIPLIKQLYIEPSLAIIQKGAQFSGKADGENLCMKVNPTYLEIPVMLGYKIALLEGVKFTVHAGAYASYGFGGKWSYETAEGNHESDAFGNTLSIEKSEAFSKKRWDCGVDAGAGIEVDRFLFRATYALGLTQVKRDAYGSIKNRGLAFAIGYRF